MNWQGDPTGVYTMGELLGGAIGPPPSLIPGIILDKSITQITAAPYTGKSLMLAHLILSLDTGLPFLGKFTPLGTRRVLGILQDSPDWDYAEQFRRISRGMGITQDQRELLETRLILGRDVRLCEKTFRDELVEVHKNKHTTFDVLALDVLSEFHDFDENSAQQMGWITKAIKWLRNNLGVAVIFTHHDRKMNAADAAALNPNYRARGSSKLPGAIDFHFYLSRQGQRVRMEMPKARGEDQQIITFNIIEVDHADGRAFQLVADGAENKLARLHTFLLAPRARREMEEFYRAEFRLNQGQAKRAVDHDLRILLNSNKVERAEKYGWWKAKGEPPR